MNKQDATIKALKKRIRILEIKVRNQGTDIHHIYTGFKSMMRK